MANWQDGKPFIVSQKYVDIKHWGGSHDGKIRCGLCGEKFDVGDVARWQYTNDTPNAGGNPFVCEDCDGTKEEICKTMINMRTEYSRLKKILG